jgi:hypothetical protein
LFLVPGLELTVAVRRVLSGDLVSESNKYLVGVTAPRHLLLRKAAMYVTRILRCFGLLEGTDDLGFPALGGGGDVESTVTPYLDAMVSFRDNVRTIARELKLTQVRLSRRRPLPTPGCAVSVGWCLGLRQREVGERSAAGDVRRRARQYYGGPGRARGGPCGWAIAVEAGRPLHTAPRGATHARSGRVRMHSLSWRLMCDGGGATRQVEEKKQKVAEAAAKKRANKIDQAAKELAKWQAAARLPADYFRTGANEGKYSEFDANHLPLKAADGTEVSKKALKNNEKELAKHVAAHAQLQEKGGDSFLQTLVDELAAMQLET